MLFPTSTSQSYSSGTANYLVSNTSTGASLPLTITFDVVACEDVIAVCPTPPPVTLSPGQSTIVWVTYYGGPTTGQCQLLLRATSYAPDNTWLSSSAIVQVSVTGAKM